MAVKEMQWCLKPPWGCQPIYTTLYLIGEKIAACSDKKSKEMSRSETYETGVVLSTEKAT